MGRLLVALALVPALAGCVAVNGTEGSVYDPMDAVPKTYDDAGPGTMTKVGEAVLSVPETVVWWPYKIASSTLRGGYDGIAGGLTKAPVPVLGVLASPLTGAAGVVNGTVKSVDAKGAVIQLDGDVEGYLRASEVARERVEDIRSRLKEGERVSAMVINIDRKNRAINLSLKAKDLAEEAEAMKKLADEKQASSGTTSLGALLKAKLDVAKTQQ